ncbi:MAG: hypothetical protein WBN23_04470 [Woeseia sp.]
MAADPEAVAGVPAVLRVADLSADELARVADRYGLEVVQLGDRERIPGSFWGEPEAGIIGARVFVRRDTPLHSLLHEMSHIICMDPARRAVLERDANSDDAEEAAVCYLQIVLADEFSGAGRERLMRDMDAWGYSFRLGSTRRWFTEDAADANAWLESHSLLNAAGRAGFRLREK